MEEKNKAVLTADGHAGFYPQNATIYELFERQVKIVQDNVALQLEEKRLTYQQLMESC